MIDSNLLLAAKIYARAESLYDVARGLSENAPLDYDRVSAALNIMGIRERERPAGSLPLPTVHEMVGRAYQKARQRRRGYQKIWDRIIESWRARKEEQQRAALAASMGQQSVQDANQTESI